MLIYTHPTKEYPANCINFFSFAQRPLHFKRMCILFQYYYLIFGSQKKISANTIIKNLLIKKEENGDVFLYSDVMSDNIKISVYLKCNKNGLENANGIIGASNFLPLLFVKFVCKKSSDENTYRIPRIRYYHTLTTTNTIE